MTGREGSCIDLRGSRARTRRRRWTVGLTRRARTSWSEPAASFGGLRAVVSACMQGADGVDEGIRQVGDPAGLESGRSGIRQRGITDDNQMATRWQSDHNQMAIR